MHPPVSVSPPAHYYALLPTIFSPYRSGTFRPARKKSTSVTKPTQRFHDTPAQREPKLKKKKKDEHQVDSEQQISSLKLMSIQPAFPISTKNNNDSDSDNLGIK